MSRSVVPAQHFSWAGHPPGQDFRDEASRILLFSISLLGLGVPHIQLREWQNDGVWRRSQEPGMEVCKYHPARHGVPPDHQGGWDALSSACPKGKGNLVQ